MTAVRNLTLLVMCLILIAGCGFKLRGASPVPQALQPLAVDCQGGIPLELCNAVLDQLELGEVNVVDENEAAYRLVLRDFNQQRRASAITQQAAAAEYDLRQSVRVDVVSTDQVPLVTNAQIRSSETYRYDEDNVLAKQREEREIRESLYGRLAQQIIFRLAPLDQQRIDRTRAEAGEQDAGEGTETEAGGDSQ